MTRLYSSGDVAESISEADEVKRKVARRHSVTFLTVIPSPYQRELFGALHSSGHFDLRVYYYANRARDRLWAGENLRPFETVLSGRTIPFLGGSAHLNPGVLRALGRCADDLYVVSDYSAPTAQVAMRYLSARSARWIFWGETPGFNDRRYIGRLARRWLQAPIARACGIAAIGSRATEAYRSRFPTLPVFNIPYFCDLEPYRAASIQAKRTQENVDVLFSGQLIPRKGADILIDAFALIAEACPELRLLLLGDGPLREQLAERVQPNLRNRVAFLGHCSPDKLPDVFAGVDMFVLPARHDGWGIVINEALGAGLPIIASDGVGAAPDLVRNGVNGFIVPVGAVDELAHALWTLAKSATLRMDFGKASRAFAEQWGLEEAVVRWTALCNALSGKVAAQT